MESEKQYAMFIHLSQLAGSIVVGLGWILPLVLWLTKKDSSEYIDANGKSTSRTIRKLGTLKELLVEHDPTRDDVMAWAKEQARIETDYEFITKRKSTAGKAI